MEIEIGGGLTVRTWREEDAPAIAKYANNRNIWRNLLDSFPHPYALEDAETWLQKVKAEPAERVFAISRGEEAIGTVGARPQLDVFRRTAEVGYWLGEPFWGRGIATRAVLAVVQYAFMRMDVARLQGHVFEWNPASCRVLEKAGFRLEARERMAVTKDGYTMDEFAYVLLKEEWERRRG